MLLSSCARVKISDGEFCGDLGSDGATCFKTLSGETRDISPSDWDEERFGMVCSDSGTFAEWKAAIKKLCAYSRRCTYEDKKSIENFGINIENFKVKINEIQ